MAEFPSGTKWHVSKMEGKEAGDAEGPLWIFEDQIVDERNKARLVYGQGVWKGQWQVIHPQERIMVTIKEYNDAFVVVFLSPKWFIAVKNNAPYRIGRNVIP